jgi:hypothetical protein
VTPKEAIADARSLGLILAAGNFAAPLRECKDLVRGSIKGNFDSATAPDGGAWPARKPRPGDDGHPLLDDTGFLKAAALCLVCISCSSACSFCLYSYSVRTTGSVMRSVLSSL